MTVNVDTLPLLSAEGDNVNSVHKHARFTDHLFNSIEIPRDVTFSKLKVKIQGNYAVLMTLL